MPNLKKCEFWPENVSFLRHVVLNDGISIDLSKDRNSGQMGATHQCLGDSKLIGVSRLLSKIHGRILQALRSIDHSNKKECSICLDRGMRREFPRATTEIGYRTYPLPSDSKGFVIYSDASKKGLRYVLMQQGKVVAYAPR